MTAPNLLALTSATGKTLVANLVTSAISNTILLATGSNQVFKINTIILSNITGSVGYDATLYHYDGSTARPFAYQITIPSKSSLVLTDKTGQFYLEENQTIQGGASANSSLTVLISYEILA